MESNKTNNLQQNKSNESISGIKDSRIQESNSLETVTQVNSRSPEFSKELINSLADTKNMDEPNKRAFNVLMNGTEKDFIKHVFTEQGTGRVRSYAEMRMMYG